MTMNRAKHAWWILGWTIAWAIVSTLKFLVHVYHGLLVCRFLLGITEATFYPSVLFEMSLFVTCLKFLMALMTANLD